MNISEQQRVREFAHQIWESEGCPDGQASRHWEMACELAASKNNDHSQQAAPLHKTVQKNDTDMINKPGKAKTKALKMSEAANAAGQDGIQANLDSVNQNRIDMSSTAMEGLPEPQSAPGKVSRAKEPGGKAGRSKKAKILKDTMETEMPKI